MRAEVEEVLRRLAWMRGAGIWPNGPRYLWTDAFGVVLLVSLRDELGDDRFVQEAEWVVTEVERVLGRPRGIRIGEAPRSRWAVLSLPGDVALRAPRAR
jgi:hypothetical protein